MPHHTHNFLKARSVVSRRQHPVARGAFIAFGVLAVIVGVTVLLVAPFLYVSERVYSRAEQGKAALEDAQRLAEAGQFGEAGARIHDAEDDFTAAQAELNRIVLLQRMPIIGPHLLAGDKLLTSGIAAAHAVGAVLDVADRMTAVMAATEGIPGSLTGSLPDFAKRFKELTPEQKRRVLAVFSDSVPQMREALVQIDAAIAAFDQIPQEAIAAGIADALRPMRPKLLNIRTGLTLLLPIAEKAPALLGYPEARHYLFFFQNDTELRPTGGFLGVYGMATVKDADLAEMLTEDVYALDGPSEAFDRPASPEPIRKYLGVTKWFLRDANWSPDFTVASSQMARFFDEEYVLAKKLPAPAIDGVLAIDTQVAQDVLRITGPITVQGKTFNADNVVDELEFAVEKGFVKQGIASNERKGIVGELVKAVIDKLESMPVDRLLASFDVAKKNLDQGHILLAMNDPKIEGDILDKDWGGKIKPVRDDYVSVIDANLASLKSDPTVNRTVSYAIAPQPDGSIMGTVRMTYQHKGRFDWKTTRYRTYVRAYVPLGSKFIGVTGAMENDKIKDPGRHAGKADVSEDLQRASFGAFISIEPGETKTIEFKFVLAPSVVSAIKKGTYRLDVEKQAGTVSHGLTLDLDFGKKVTTAVPPEDRKYWGDTHFSAETDLRLDRAFDIGLQ